MIEEQFGGVGLSFNFGMQNFALFAFVRQKSI
jgi:hypothetical protein